MTRGLCRDSEGSVEGLCHLVGSESAVRTRAPDVSPWLLSFYCSSEVRTVIPLHQHELSAWIGGLSALTYA